MITPPLEQLSAAVMAPGAEALRAFGLARHDLQILAVYGAIGFAVWAVMRAHAIAREKTWGDVLTAEIVGIVCDGQRPDYPKVSFETRSGERVTQVADTPCTDETCRIGRKIPVKYDPASRRCEPLVDDTPHEQRRHLFTIIVFATLLSLGLAAPWPDAVLI